MANAGAEARSAHQNHDPPGRLTATVGLLAGARNGLAETRSFHGFCRPLFWQAGGGSGWRVSTSII